MTLVGYSGKLDINHHWDGCLCIECHKSWTMEWKGEEKLKGYNVWHVDSNNHVIAGIPSCFESYVYTCSECGGDVKRHFFDKDTRNTAKCLSQKIGGERYYDIYFICEDCKVEEKCSNDHYIFYNPHKPIRPSKNWLITGWKIIQETGIVVINDSGISRIDLIEEKNE
jgi:hypothetical protein